MKLENTETFKFTEVDPTRQLPWDVEITIGYKFSTETTVGYVRHEDKVILPSHGYCSPNHIGNLMAKYAEKIGYTFKNY